MSVHLSLTAPLAARGLRPVAELASTRPHGDRLEYMAGCRCPACRKANSLYERGRQIARQNGEWNGLVAADKARQHILLLSKNGVGRKSVAAATDIGVSIINAIRSGVRTQIRANTERKILAVTSDCRSDHSLIPAGPTWTLIADILADGHSKGWIAKQIGNQRPALQIRRDRVLAKTAQQIERLHRELGCEQISGRKTRHQIQKLLDEGYLPKLLKEKLPSGDFDRAMKPGAKLPVRLVQAVNALFLQLTE